MIGSSVIDKITIAWTGFGGRLRQIWGAGDSPKSEVDMYWRRHVVNSTRFRSVEESEAYLEWRFAEYPLFRELMGMFGDHQDETILDYGCGPGDDLVGFATRTKARRVIGVDVSSQALKLAAQRLSLYRMDRHRVELIPWSDAGMSLPLPDESVDYINCGGVLHHVSDPERILEQFCRVLRRGGIGRIMVYNRNSIWFHLYTAYMKMVLEGAFRGMEVEEAFSRNTDGEKCPVSRCYVPDAFLEMLSRAGLQAKFVGAYFSRHELGWFRRLGQSARWDPRLSEEHRVFLRNVTLDDVGRPCFQGASAGIGGVYTISKS